MGKRTAPSDAESLHRALSVHRSGRLREAEGLYRRIIKRAPGNADAHHFLGLLRHQSNDLAGALELVRTAVHLAPSYVDAHNNLGNLLRLAGKLDEAEAAYRTALSLKPDDTNALNNLGIVLRRRGRRSEAEGTFRKVIALDHRHVPALNNLGSVLAAMGRAKEAIGYLNAAVAFDPSHPDAPRALGMAYMASGDLDSAREVFRIWKARDPANAEAEHMFRACVGDPTLARADDAYVRSLFDRMASTFDEHLAELGYQAPAMVEAVCKTLWPRPHADMDVLDAGCGTGLCAAFLRPHARRLEGVDLSPGMLARAKDTGLYDELSAAELTAFMNERTQLYDLVICADTLCYFGDLSAVLSAARKALRPGGYLVFTLERAAIDRPAGYCLDRSGRYSHTEAYVRAELVSAGLTAGRLESGVLRQEAGEDVHGMLIVAVAPT